jgi:hypothetical protein
MRISSRCATGGAQWHASLSMCIASPVDYVHNTTNFASPSSSASQFAGFYQVTQHTTPLSPPHTPPSPQQQHQQQTKCDIG